MTDTLRVTGGEYELTSSAQGVGVVAIARRAGNRYAAKAAARSAPEGLAPRSFTEQRGDNYKLSADFNWPGARGRC